MAPRWPWLWSQGPRLLNFPQSHVTEPREGSFGDEDILVEMRAVNWNRVQ